MVCQRILYSVQFSHLFLRCTNFTFIVSVCNFPIYCVSVQFFHLLCQCAIFPFIVSVCNFPILLLQCAIVSIYFYSVTIFPYLLVAINTKLYTTYSTVQCVYGIIPQNVISPVYVQFCTL